jgi:hypothetical protein
MTSYELTFETPNPVEVSSDCFVKYTFPNEIDISEIDLTDIQGSGMLVDQDGNVQVFTDD